MQPYNSTDTATVWRYCRFSRFERQDICYSLGRFKCGASEARCYGDVGMNCKTGRSPVIPWWQRGYLIKWTDTMPVVRHCKQMVPGDNR